MESKNLNKELLIRIFGNIGAVAGENFGKVGLTTDEYLIKKNITIKEDDEILSYDVWAGSIETSSGNLKATLTNLGTNKEPEFILILIRDNITLGFRLLYDNNDVGYFAQKIDKDWMPLSFLYKLNLAVLFEMIAQEGFTWEPLEDIDEVYNCLLSLVENVEKEN